MIEAKALHGKEETYDILIRLADVSAVYEVPAQYPDFAIKYKVCLTNRATFTFDETEGGKIYNAYKAHLRGE